MNKTKAIKVARNRVGQIYPFGDNYKFNYFDESVNAWRESIGRDYFNCVYHRSQEMICEAMRLMGFDKDICFSAISCYLNGSWTDHLNDMIDRFAEGHDVEI